MTYCRFCKMRGYKSELVEIIEVNNKSQTVINYRCPKCGFSQRGNYVDDDRRDSLQDNRNSKDD